jgi:hypothetical protein
VLLTKLENRDGRASGFFSALAKSRQTERNIDLTISRSLGNWWSPGLLVHLTVKGQLSIVNNHKNSSLESHAVSQSKKKKTKKEKKISMSLTHGI